MRKEKRTQIGKPEGLFNMIKAIRCNVMLTDDMTVRETDKGKEGEKRANSKRDMKQWKREKKRVERTKAAERLY